MTPVLPVSSYLSPKCPGHIIMTRSTKALISVKVSWTHYNDPVLPVSSYLSPKCPGHIIMTPVLPVSSYLSPKCPGHIIMTPVLPVSSYLSPKCPGHIIMTPVLPHQWQENKGKCGVCGDPWDSNPRPNEMGGKYFNGLIARTYHTDDSHIDIEIEVEKNKHGYFEFRLCPEVSDNNPVSQECLDRFPLEIVGHGQRFYPSSARNVYLQIAMPEGLVCERCVLQWKWHTALHWGRCANGSSQVGCGDQTEIYNCADISILPRGHNSFRNTLNEATNEFNIPIIQPESQSLDVSPSESPLGKSSTYSFLIGKGDLYGVPVSTAKSVTKSKSNVRIAKNNIVVDSVNSLPENTKRIDKSSLGNKEVVTKDVINLPYIGMTTSVQMNEQSNGVSPTQDPSTVQDNVEVIELSRAKRNVKSAPSSSQVVPSVGNPSTSTTGSQGEGGQAPAMPTASKDVTKTTVIRNVVNGHQSAPSLSSSSSSMTEAKSPVKGQEWKVINVNQSPEQKQPVTIQETNPLSTSQFDISNIAFANAVNDFTSGTLLSHHITDSIGNLANPGTYNPSIAQFTGMMHPTAYPTMDYSTYNQQNQGLLGISMFDHGIVSETQSGFVDTTSNVASWVEQTAETTTAAVGTTKAPSTTTSDLPQSNQVKIVEPLTAGTNTWSVQRMFEPLPPTTTQAPWVETNPTWVTVAPSDRLLTQPVMLHGTQQLNNQGIMGNSDGTTTQTTPSTTVSKTTAQTSTTQTPVESTKLVAVKEEKKIIAESKPVEITTTGVPTTTERLSTHRPVLGSAVDSIQPNAYGAVVEDLSSTPAKAVVTERTTINAVQIATEPPTTKIDPTLQQTVVTTGVTKVTTKQPVVLNVPQQVPKLVKNVAPSGPYNVFKENIEQPIDVDTVVKQGKDSAQGIKNEIQATIKEQSVKPPRASLGMQEKSQVLIENMMLTMADLMQKIKNSPQLQPGVSSVKTTIRRIKQNVDRNIPATPSAKNHVKELKMVDIVKTTKSTPTPTTITSTTKRTTTTTTTEPSTTTVPPSPPTTTTIPTTTTTQPTTTQSTTTTQPTTTDPPVVDAVGGASMSFFNHMYNPQTTGTPNAWNNVPPTTVSPITWNDAVGSSSLINAGSGTGLMNDVPATQNSPSMNQNFVDLMNTLTAQNTAMQSGGFTNQQIVDIINQQSSTTTNIQGGSLASASGTGEVATLNAVELQQPYQNVPSSATNQILTDNTLNSLEAPVQTGHTFENQIEMTTKPRTIQEMAAGGMVNVDWDALQGRGRTAKTANQPMTGMEALIQLMKQQGYIQPPPAATPAPPTTTTTPIPTTTTPIPTTTTPPAPTPPPIIYYAEDLTPRDVDPISRAVMLKMIKSMAPTRQYAQNTVQVAGQGQYAHTAASGQGQYPHVATTGQGQYPQAATTGQGQYPQAATTGQGQYPQAATTGQGQYSHTATTGQEQYPHTAASGQGQYPQAATTGQGQYPQADTSGQGQTGYSMTQPQASLQGAAQAYNRPPRPTIDPIQRAMEAAMTKQVLQMLGLVPEPPDVPPGGRRGGRGRGFGGGMDPAAGGAAGAYQDPYAQPYSADPYARPYGAGPADPWRPRGPQAMTPEWAGVLGVGT
ncbi:unnamed protein product [Mytilus coruscus]|uniref:Uncharacterized protein n=1 Tax=Mytilus coruscus TaxID=42192 RepID=A0A6J8A038_MYTCO|nr:unnamed protein product [Mytilus coruscus]